MMTLSSDWSCTEFNVKTVESLNGGSDGIPPYDDISIWLDVRILLNHTHDDMYSL